MAHVHLRGIKKAFDGGITAVDNLNLVVEDQDFLVLVGPSGCGKSTTLRLVAGLETADAGEIFIGDTDVTRLPPKDRDVAMVFQNYALYPHMTVRENLSFGLKMKNLPAEEIGRRVAETVRILEIEDLLERKPKALSGGQRQRVALGRAIVRDARVFLFDEPLSNLDAKLRVQMRAEIIKLHNRIRRTTIYVTHDQVEAMTMGRRIAVMRDGRIQQLDTPMNIYNYPVNMFVAGFIGSPSMNFIEGSLVRSDGLKFIAGGCALDLPEHYADYAAGMAENALVFGFRPEDASLEEGPGQRTRTAKLRAIVDVVEPMGNETLLSCSFGGAPVTVRAKPSFSGVMGETIELHINMEKAHVFDAANGMRIVPKGN